MITLIVDSGSTKTNWAILKNGIKEFDFQTDGLNPYVHSAIEIEKVLTEMRSILKMKYSPEKIFFYGAGCSSASLAQKIEDGFIKVGFEAESVFVSHDLMAAVHALFQNNSGIGCILGTGSSSAHYSNGIITESIPSLGYVLGDEGGGVDLGKRLLISIYKKEAPKYIQIAFQEKYNLKIDEMLHHIYFDQSPNRFLASFSIFISENIHEQFLHELVLKSFRSFISLNVMKYQDIDSLSVGFVGSVALYFKDILIEVLMEFGLKQGIILKSPMEGLITYHNSNLS